MKDKPIFQYIVIQANQSHYQIPGESIAQAVKIWDKQFNKTPGDEPIAVINASRTNSLHFAKNQKNDQVTQVKELPN